LTPNVSDGVADAFGINDLFVLKYKNTGGGPVADEIDDGLMCCGVPADFQINPWLNGESLLDQDVVVWYGAHFIHSDQNNLLNPDRSGFVISGSHVVGPDIRPVRW
jgi:hypothetical protein